MPPADPSSYAYNKSGLNISHGYLLPTIKRLLTQKFESPAGIRVFDLGCGNGCITHALSSEGYHVTGVDPSSEGIAMARQNYPSLDLHQGSGYDDLAALFGQYDAVISLEVIEHLYDPRQFVKMVKKLLKPSGIAIISTPYHGYWKNLALALTGKMDKHFTALWDHGHIKFWSIPTLRQLLEEQGFTGIEFLRVGRVPFLAKSMVAVVTH